MGWAKSPVDGIWRGNAKFSAVLPFEDGDTIAESNLMQPVPHTPICQGVAGLTFIKCKLLNCDVPGDAVKEGCYEGHRDFCSNKHPKWVSMGFLAAEPVDCPHVIASHSVTIDGQSIVTGYDYEDSEVP